MGMVILGIVLVLAYRKLSKNNYIITNLPLLVGLGGIGASLAFSNTGTATVFGWAIIAYAAANAIIAYRRRSRDEWYLQ